MGKSLIIIGDGMGGRDCPETDKTCLEMADTPNMDLVASEGICGLMDPISPGIRAGSDTSHLAIFGYDPYECYSGRGPLEALGAGMELKVGDIAFRFNFATVDEDGIVVDRRAGRIDSEEGTPELAKLLDGLKIDGVEVLCTTSTGHRGAMVLRGKGLSPAVSDTDPHITGEPVLISEALESGSEKTADILNEIQKRAFELFSSSEVNKEREEEGKLPANTILIRGAGDLRPIEKFRERYGFNGVAVVEVGLIIGIARFLGLEVVTPEGATGGYDTNEYVIANAVIEALERSDFVFVNMKTPDLGGHDGDMKKKITAIEKVDHLVGLIFSDVNNMDIHLVISADHATPITYMDHTGDPVPCVFWGKNVVNDEVQSYHERACYGGGLGRITGMDIMPILMNLSGQSEKFGA